MPLFELCVLSNWSTETAVLALDLSCRLYASNCAAFGCYESIISSAVLFLLVAYSASWMNLSVITICLSSLQVLGALPEVVCIWCMSQPFRAWHVICFWHDQSVLCSSIGQHCVRSYLQVCFCEIEGSKWSNVVLVCSIFWMLISTSHSRVVCNCQSSYFIVRTAASRWPNHIVVIADYSDAVCSNLIIGDKKRCCDTVHLLTYNCQCVSMILWIIFIKQMLVVLHTQWSLASSQEWDSLTAVTDTSPDYHQWTTNTISWSILKIMIHLSISKLLLMPDPVMAH
jgi:hypothetical protein